MANTLKFGNGQWATGNGTALAYNDENANFKPLPFDFTRASSGTTVNQSGLIETVGSGIPRIDFQGNTKGALLLEPSRTNSVTYSEDFSHSSYSKTNATVTSGFLAPDGTNNATKLVTSAVNAQLLFSAGGGNTNTKVVSVFAKANTSTSKFKIIEQYYSGQQTLFDLNLGVVEFNNSAGSKIENFGNGWFRCTHIQSYTSGQTNSTFAFRTPTAESLFIWGAQLEEGSYATSYIPTSGSAVTRVAETNIQTPPSGVIGQTEGTVFLDMTRDSLESYTQRVLTLSNGTTNNVIGLQLTGGNQITFYVENGGSNQVAITKSNATISNQKVKIAAAYKANDFALYIDGVQVGVDTSGSVPATSIIKYSNPSNALQYVGVVNNFKLYNTRLSNSELAALTTI